MNAALSRLDSFPGDGRQRPCSAVGAPAASQPFGDGLRVDGAIGVRGRFFGGICAKITASISK